VPFGLDWVRLQGQRAGFYGTEVGLSMLSVSSILILVLLIWWSVNALSKMEAARAGADAGLHAQLALVADQRDALSRQAELIEHSHDAIITMDSNRGITGWNRGAREIYGWTASEAQGQVIHLLLRTTSHVTTAEIDAILAGKGRWDGELKHVAKDGNARVVDSRQVLMRNAAGVGVGVLEINRDVTASRSVEEQLRQVQKLDSIGRLAGGVAHDFNNLLTIIGGYAHMLIDDLSLADSHRESVQEISVAADRAATITRQLLTFSRHHAGSSRKNIILNEVVSEMEKMLHRLIGEDIQLDLVMDRTPLVVNADSGQMEQVVMNLVINSRDAMPDGGRILIETSQVVVDEAYAATHLGIEEGLYAVLSVSDNGIGMPAEVRARIFEPFFTTKDAGKGTGLGLATVYGIVKQNQGAVYVYSEPGQGSTFKVLFPAAEGPVDRSVPAPLPRSLAGLETIFLVEDEDALRKYVRETLERYGYTVVAAGNGREAVEIAERHPAPLDLLLTDVVMPELGGVDLAERFAVLRPGTPVLHMSGYSERLRKQGNAANFIQKPFTPRELLTHVRTLLDAYRAKGDATTP
jgi:PAS domain S-box-containing protein